MWWKQIIVIIYISQLIYFIRLGWVVHLSLSDWLLLFTLECTVVLIAFEWFRRLDEDYVRKLHDRDIEREKLEGYIRKHDKKLIDTAIKPWYEAKFVSVANEPLTTEHLQTGYADIWKLRQEYTTIKDDLSSEENAIKEYIKNRLNPDLPRWGFTRDFTVENPEEIIYKSIETFSKKGEKPDNYTAYLSNFGFDAVDVNNDADERSQVREIEYFRKCVEMIVKDKTLYDKFETRNKTRKLSYEKIDEFYQGLEKIEHDFEEKYIPLKGTCKDCKDWHDELEFLT